MKRTSCLLAACVALFYTGPAKACTVSDTAPCSAWAGPWNPYAPAIYKKRGYKKHYVKRAHKKWAGKKAWKKRTYARQVKPVAITQKDKANIFKRYAAASRGSNCLTADTNSILQTLQSKFSVSIVGTCANRNIAGTRVKSFHAFGRAVDFSVPADQKSAAVDFLRSQPVLVMTYHNMGHIHFNTGQKGTILAANAYGGGGKKYARSKYKTRYAKRYKKRHRYAAVR